TPGKLPGAPATFAPIEILVRDHSRKAAVLPVIGTAFAGEEPTGRGVNAVEARRLTILLVHPRVEVFALNREWAVHPGGFGTGDERAVRGDFAGVNDVRSEMALGA